VILHILSYNHDQLHHLVSKSLTKYGAAGQEPTRKQLPISLPIKINIFREYSAVFLSTKFNLKICQISAFVGNLSALQWLRSQDCPWDVRTCSEAAFGGHLIVLQWARSQGCPWNNLTCFLAYSHGHLAVLQWARSQGCPEWKGFHDSLCM
jgi:hypothetical protein